jgi:hypothetical protein
MSDLQHALDLFGLMSIDDVTADTLKKAFKTHILKAHPDKGGDAKIFDDMLQSYVYLSETVQRVSGGRATLQNIISPDELKNMRPDEIVNRLFEEFEREEFNKMFDEEYESLLNTHGYNKWLKNTDSEDNLIEGEFGNATQKPPTFDEKDFNKIFEQKNKEGKPELTAIILHPEQMAYISGQNIGTEIIESNEGGFTSQIFTNPKYTDAYEAFSNLTVIDKLPVYTETNKTLDELIAERNKEITPFNNTELQAIQNYEKKKLEKTNQHYSNIKNHFKYNDTYVTHLSNWPPEKYDDSAYKGFRMDF